MFSLIKPDRSINSTYINASEVQKKILFQSRTSNLESTSINYSKCVTVSDSTCCYLNPTKVKRLYFLLYITEKNKNIPDVAWSAVLQIKNWTIKNSVNYWPGIAVAHTWTSISTHSHTHVRAHTNRGKISPDMQIQTHTQNASLGPACCFCREQTKSVLESPLAAKWKGSLWLVHLKGGHTDCVAPLLTSIPKQTQPKPQGCSVKCYVLWEKVANIASPRYLLW